MPKYVLIHDCINIKNIYIKYILYYHITVLIKKKKKLI